MLKEVLLDHLEALGRFAAYSTRIVATLPTTLVRRAGETLRQFERVTWGGLPVALAAGFSVGLVTWVQTHRLMVENGFEAQLPSVLAVAVFVETGPLLASLLVAGRLGAGLAAELGSMTLTEEIDAREVLGAPVLQTLVAPRVLACLIGTPFLTICLDAAAWVGALCAELGAGTLSTWSFQERSLDFLRLVDLVPATLKTSLFGMIIGLIGCWTGLRTDRSTEAVGRAATRGVVRSMLAVFAANALIVPIVHAFVTWLGWTG
ncbi:MAG: MlaE family lipid ABC transporter permease subunit [Isosphaeraceae bacterium]